MKITLKERSSDDFYGDMYYQFKRNVLKSRNLKAKIFLEVE